jgi:hypothetical protein
MLNLLTTWQAFFANLCHSSAEKPGIWIKEANEQVNANFSFHFGYLTSDAGYFVPSF